MMRNKEDVMLVSEWKDEFDTGVWTAMNCTSPGRAPQIVGGKGITGFLVFATDGAIINCGDAFKTFEDAAKWLESVFTWEVKLS
jgi:hypothetical protein